MRLSDLNYRLYRATDGETCFWRWEVLPKGKGKGNSSTPLKSGFLYGIMADAKQRASAAMSELARIKERPRGRDWITEIQQITSVMFLVGFAPNLFGCRQAQRTTARLFISRPRTYAQAD